MTTSAPSRPVPLGRRQPSTAVIAMATPTTNPMPRAHPMRRSAFIAWFPLVWDGAAEGVAAPSSRFRGAVG
jgi:hypothetical protein